MKVSPLSLSLALASLATASPVPQSSQQDYSTEWNDPYIPEPINFQLRNAGPACDFQLVYERFSVDSRYNIDYVAEYADGTSTPVSGISGTLPRDNIWLVDGLADDRALQVVYFQDICRNGQGPSSFRVNAQLGCCYTYENNWTSGSFGFTGGSLPSTPQELRLVSSSKSSTVTWSGVPEAQGYVVMVRWLVDSELGPDTIPFVWARQLGAEERSFTYNRDFTHAAVLAEGGDERAFSSLRDVADVRPS